MDAVEAYSAVMVTIRARLFNLSLKLDEDLLTRAERFALHIRKITEGVAYASLSATEMRNKNALAEQRTKDADKVLVWLRRKGLLRLPAAQRVQESKSLDYKTIFSGEDGNLNWGVDEILTTFSRASALLHERHPERLTKKALQQELSALEHDASRLRDWLWLHIIFLEEDAHLIQMGQYGTRHFMVNISKSDKLGPVAK